MSTATDTFGSLVRQYILRQRLSYQEIADTLGYKSKTSIARIIQGETSYNLRQQFFQRLSRAYDIPPQEAAALKEALRFSRLTPQDQAYFACYAELMHKDYSAESEQDCTCITPQGEAVSLRALLDQQSETCYQIELSVFGEPDKGLVSALYQMLSECGCAFTVTQYIFTDDDVMPLLRSVTDNASILFDPRYRLHRCPRAPGLPTFDNFLLLHYSTDEGNDREDMILPDASGRLMLAATADGQMTALIRRAFKAGDPLVSEYRADSQEELLAAFVQLQKNICELESDCAIYSFTKGLSSEFIAPQVLRNAFLPGRMVPENFRAAAAQLERLHKARHQQLLTRRKPMHFILSPAAFQRFIWTGRLVNHPPFLRPLTVKERSDVLSMIMEQLKENPYFSIRFTTDDIPSVLTHMSLTCYQHFHHTSAHQAVLKGSLFIRPGVSSPERLVCAELRDPQLAESYAHFFLEELIPQYTQPAQNTSHFLANMMDYLRPKLP